MRTLVPIKCYVGQDTHTFNSEKQCQLSDDEICSKLWCDGDGDDGMLGNSIRL
jgi:hypothetical protein